MFSRFNQDEYRQSKSMWAIQIFLLILIILGIVLLFTQDKWVPTVTNYILDTEFGMKYFPKI